jgi:hypothetical protein
MEFVLSEQIKGLTDANGNLYSDVADLYAHPSCDSFGWHHS